ncbi:MAG: hypothetical protein AAFV72_17535 [Cyanobacteria bacterium J06635_1]
MLDVLEGLSYIGEWEQKWWGCIWTLTSDEINCVQAKIRQEMALSATPLLIPGGQTLSPIIGALEAAYLVLSNRLKAADKGHGVVVHFPLDYISSGPLGWAITSPGFPLNLNWTKNISHIRSL